MQNIANPSTFNGGQTTPPNSDSLHAPMGTVIPRTEPMGFGEQRRQEIFQDDPYLTQTNYSAEASYAPAGGSGLGSPHPPFAAFDGPYKRTFLIIEFTPEGIRVNIQATKKGFLIGGLIIIALVSLPNFSNTIQLLIKAILTGQ